MIKVYVLGLMALISAELSTLFCQNQIEKGSAIPSDGTQNRDSITCSSTPLGILPKKSKMTSTLIIQPLNNAKINLREENIVKVSIRNMVSGFFSDAITFYYTSPQELENGGIRGHIHITMQLLNGKNIPDPTKFDFFKGVNTPALSIDGENLGTLEAVIPANSLRQAGLYRICSMTGSFTHQPQLSPLFRRGPIEDCIRVEVG